MTCLGGELVEWDLGSFLRVSRPPPPPLQQSNFLSTAYHRPRGVKG
jgi:hypothetical protein